MRPQRGLAESLPRHNRWTWLTLGATLAAMRTVCHAFFAAALCGCRAPQPTAVPPAPTAPPAAGAPTAPTTTTPVADPALTQRCTQLAEKALTDNHAIEILKGLLTAAPKRLSGSPGYDAAVRWGLATMREIGLDNVHTEPCMVPCWVRGEERAEVVGAGAMPLRITALGGSVATPEGGIEAEIVEVRSFEQLRALGEAARGKIVFFNRPMPRALRRTGQAYGEAVPQRTNGAVEAGKQGAVGAIVRSVTTAIDGHPHTGAMNYDEAVTKVPAAAIATEDAEALSALMKQGPVRVHLVLGCETRPDVAAANVIGELRGSVHPDEIVLIGGHLDAWDLGRGAHDDGAGIAHVLEALRLLETCGIRGKRTIRAVLFANEENGLRGALAYAAAHADELPKHTAAIETDGGGFSPQGFSCSLRDAEAEAVHALFLPLQDLGAGVFASGAGAGGADIGPLAKAAVPCFGLWVDGQRYFDYHHSEVDDLPMVNERELALGAAVIAYAASVLADR
ncbi:MAG TPA: M20/M25/M40 family metallo-hydrolase [Planctomycetota bacterium]|nr:M20/M25/M40 family metallo-hydrolase [Planctomycetota bacterium]